MKTIVLGACVVLFSAIVSDLSAAQRREITWNNPNGPAVAGVEHGSYMSPSLKKEVGYNVFLPPGYASDKARYPVIYFLHGAGGDENSDAGGFSGLVGGMIAAKKIPSVICVFPNGGMSGYQDRPATGVLGESLIVKELIPLVDRTYRTRAEREGRVITGFSMGGGGAVRLSLKHPDLFSAAASWAGAILLKNVVDPPEVEPVNLEDMRGRIRLLLIVGDKDITYGGTRMFIERLDRAKFPYRCKILPGVTHNMGQYYEKTGDELVRFLADKF